MGTLDYIAPEQLADTHAVDIRADLYSLGCTLFRLLTTEPPFAGPSLNTAAKKMFAHSFTPAPKLLDRRPDVPAELSALVVRLLEKQPDARFATPREVATALAPFCEGHNLPTLLASSSSAPPPSDPFASTVIPFQHDAQASGRIAQEASASVHKHSHDAPTSGLPSQPIVSQPVAQSTTERNHSLARRAKSRRALVIVGVLLAIVLLSVFLPPFLKRDASLTDDRRMAAPGRPAVPNPETQTAEGGQPTNQPTDPDRAAAEWVLSQKGEFVGVEFITTQDDQRHPAKLIDDLPKEPFQLFSVSLVNVPDVDAVALARHLGPLKSLCLVSLQHSLRVNDDVVSVFRQMPALSHLYLEDTGVTADGIFALVASRPIQTLHFDSRQFSAELASLLAKTPTLQAVMLHELSDEQLRQMFIVKQLIGLNLGFRGTTDFRHSTWARLADELPNLRSMSIDAVRCDDADLASVAWLSNLEDLFLNRLPNVTDVGLAQLESSAKLKNLALRDCAVTPLGLADFLESHPACQVVWDGADHRAVAEWVLSVGGKLQVAGRGAEWLSANVAVTAPRDEPNAPASPARSTSDPSATSNALGSSRGALTATLSGPVLLTGVDLSGLGTLKDADLARLADCTTLCDLQLHNSSLTGACLTHLTKLSRLRTLGLAYLPIEDRDLAHLSKFKQLQGLELHNTKITDAGMPSLSALTELQQIYLNDTAITNAGLESLKPLPKLFTIGLNNTRADDRTAELLCEFSTLQTVYLANTKLTEAGVKHLAQRPMPSYRLYFSNLPTVTNAILADLRGQEELVTLELGGTSVTPAAFEAFVREHPRLGMMLATDDGEAPDLRVARRVLAAGGEIVVVIATPQAAVPLSARVAFDAGRVVRRIEGLPKEPFGITIIDLRLAGAKVTDETLAEVGRLEMLGNFNTTDAAISNATVAEIAAAPKLEWLNLFSTPLSSATVRQFATKPALTSLSLGNTGLDGPTAASLAALTKLTILNINSNPLTDDDIAFVEKLAELEALGIGGTQIANRGWASIAKLPKLKQLRAYIMPVTDEALRYSGQIESLELLDVGGAASEVSDAGLQHLRSLRHLRELYLSHCRHLTDAGLESLAELPALETLHLNATPITDAGLKHLAQIKTLKSLNLTDCQLSEAALDDLQDALPWCRITK